MYIYLCVPVSRLSICLSIFLYTYICLSIDLSIYLYIYLYIYFFPFHFPIMPLFEITFVPYPRLPLCPIILSSRILVASSQSSLYIFSSICQLHHLDIYLPNYIHIYILSLYLYISTCISIYQQSINTLP